MQSKTKISLLLALIAVTAIIVLNLSKNIISNRNVFTVTNNLSNISIVELYINNSETNFLLNKLPPNFSLPLSFPQNITSLTAIDSTGGHYTPIIQQNSSEININITDRYTFECTIEDNGEYWTGIGTNILHITNSLETKDIYKLTISPFQSNATNQDNILQPFILYPNFSINMRLNPGCYSITATDDLGNLYYNEQINITEETAITSAEILNNQLYTARDVSGIGSTSIKLVNDLDDWIITGIYHKFSSDNNWSTNHLNFQFLEPKQQFTLNLSPNLYDFKIIDETNDSYTIFNVHVSDSGYTWCISMEDLDPFIP